MHGGHDSEAQRQATAAAAAEEEDEAEMHSSIIHTEIAWSAKGAGEFERKQHGSGAPGLKRVVETSWQEFSANCVSGSLLACHATLASNRAPRTSTV